MSNTDFVQINILPTFVMANNLSTTLEMIFSIKNIENCIRNIEVIPELCTDHLAVQLMIETARATPPFPQN